jgi:hypothetical protein
MERRPGLSTAALLVVALLAPAGASADDTAPAITEGPAVTGLAREGEVLTATAAWTGDPEPTAAWAWLRCDKSKTGKCTAIKNATAQTYDVAAADVGSVLRVRLELTNAAGKTGERSRPTSVVEALPPPPPPDPPPPPPPPPDPDEPPGDLPPSTPFDPPVAPVVAPPPAGVGALQAIPLLRPFPTVRIRGRLTLRGARVTLLVVRSRRGSLIVARCRGAGCPVRRVARAASSSRTRLRPFERVLRAGTRLDITVRRAGYIGKWTTIIIRRGRVPWRADRCVKPGRSRPTACPSA